MFSIGRSRPLRRTCCTWRPDLPTWVKQQSFLTSFCLRGSQLSCLKQLSLPQNFHISGPDISINFADGLPGLIVCPELQVDRDGQERTPCAIVARSKWRKKEKRPLKFTAFRNNPILIPHVSSNSHSCVTAACCGFLSWLNYCRHCAGFSERHKSSPQYQKLTQSDLIHLQSGCFGVWWSPKVRITLTLSSGRKKWNLETMYEPLVHFDCGAVGKED